MRHEILCHINGITASLPKHSQLFGIRKWEEWSVYGMIVKIYCKVPAI